MATMTAEDRVRARLEADRKTATDAAEAAGEKYAAATAELEKAAARLDKALKPFVDDIPGKKLTAKQMDAPAEAHVALGKAIRALTRAKVEFIEKLEAGEALMADKEFQRRLKAAKKFGDGGEPLTGRDAARVVLLQAGKPLHYTEITRLALESGVIRLEGKTPEATMSAYLAKAAKAGDTFVRVEPGIFDLAERVSVKA